MPNPSRCDEAAAEKLSLSCDLDDQYRERGVEEAQQGSMWAETPTDSWQGRRADGTKKNGTG